MDAIRRMLEISSKCAEEFSISFNANKSKCIVFRPVGKQTNEVLPQFLSGKPVEYVKRWPHLGNILGEEFNYSKCVKNGETC